MLISPKPNHLCPACGSVEIANCYFGSLAVPFSRHRRPAVRCTHCGARLRFAAKRWRGYWLMIIGIAIACVCSATSITKVLSVRFAVHTSAMLATGVAMHLYLLRRGAVVLDRPRPNGSPPA